MNIIHTSKILYVIRISEGIYNIYIVTGYVLYNMHIKKCVSAFSKTVKCFKVLCMTEKHY